jgi:hypothetical protein
LRSGESAEYVYVSIDEAGELHSTETGHSSAAVCSASEESRQENEEARTREAGFSLQIVSREGRYADPGHLLPMFYKELTVEPGVSALPSWLANQAQSITTSQSPQAFNTPFCWNSGRKARLPARREGGQPC